jgi:hypothetical protein
MSNNYNSKQLSDFEQEIEEEIEQARIELTTLVLEKQKNIILRMGHVLEKIRKDDRQSGICEELKLRLREEIARGILSTRTIEAYCKPEWKNPVKSKSGRKGAQSKKKSLQLLRSPVSAPESAVEVGTSVVQEKQEEGNADEDLKEEKKNTILVRTDGSDEKTPLKPNNDTNRELREQELLERLKEKDAIIIEQQQQATTLKEEAQYYKQKAEQSFAVGENESGEAGQQRRQQSAFRVTTTTATSGPEEDEKDFGEHAVRNIEFEFWLPFEALRLEMERLFRKDGTGQNLDSWRYQCHHEQGLGCRCRKTRQCCDKG